MKIIHHLIIISIKMMMTSRKKKQTHIRIFQMKVDIE